jgi:5-methylcytosine-specific restriction endonuclease McrA
MEKIKLFKPNKSMSGTSKFNGKAHIDAMYSKKEWVNYSAKYLKINKKCYCCGNFSQAVDHLKAHKGDVFLFEKEDNLIPLCHKCHNTATALFDKYYIQKYNEKLNWLARCRKINMLTFKVMVIPYP